MVHKGVVFIVLLSLVCGAQRCGFNSFVFVSLWCTKEWFFLALFSLVCGAQRSGFNSFVFVSLWRTKECFF